MASTWHTHIINTSTWTAASTRGAAVRGSWERRLDLIKSLNYSAPETHLGLIQGDLFIDAFSGWNATDAPGLSGVNSGLGTNTGGYSGFDDPTYASYTIGSTTYSGYEFDGSFAVQQLAEGYWVEITGAQLKFEE